MHFDQLCLMPRPLLILVKFKVPKRVIRFLGLLYKPSETYSKLSLQNHCFGVAHKAPLPWRAEFHVLMVKKQFVSRSQFPLCTMDFRLINKTNCLPTFVFLSLPSFYFPMDWNRAM